MRIYISGCLSKGGTLSEDEKRKNRYRFAAAAQLLKDWGHLPINPAEQVLSPPHDTWSDYMRMGLRALLTCDRIYLLPGWTKSPGAILEFFVAKAVGIEVWEDPT